MYLNDNANREARLWTHLLTGLRLPTLLSISFFIQHLIILWLAINIGFPASRVSYTSGTNAIFTVLQDCLLLPIHLKLVLSSISMNSFYICIWFKVIWFGENCLDIWISDSAKKSFICIRIYRDYSWKLIFWFPSIFHIHLPAEPVSPYESPFLKNAFIDFSWMVVFHCTLTWVSTSVFIS